MHVTLGGDSIWLVAGIWMSLAALFLVKVGAKFLGMLPIARSIFRFSPVNVNYLTLMMATGLTFGTISSLYGLTHHYIDRAQCDRPGALRAGRGARGDGGGGSVAAWEL